MAVVFSGPAPKLSGQSKLVSGEKNVTNTSEKSGGSKVTVSPSVEPIKSRISGSMKTFDNDSVKQMEVKPESINAPKPKSI